MLLVERHFREYVDPVVENTALLAPGLQLAQRRSVMKRLSGFGKMESEESNDDEEQNDLEPDRLPQWNSLHPGDTQDREHELPPIAEGAFVTKIRVPVILVITKVSGIANEDQTWREQSGRS